jgi:predicted acetyltransferase
MVAQLTAPTVAVRDSFLVAARALRDEGWLPHLPVEQAAADFDAYVAHVGAVSDYWGVPTSELWYVDGYDYLGTVIIRHRLTADLRRAGGHLGYHVAPQHRHHGHATAMLAQALPYCHRLGLPSVLVTCAVTNTASRRVIERNSGTLENILDDECRYWITTHPATPTQTAVITHEH